MNKNLLIALEYTHTYRFWEKFVLPWLGQQMLKASNINTDIKKPPEWTEFCILRYYSATNKWFGY